MRRLLAILALALCLAPGTWLRSPPPSTDTRQVVTFRALATPAVDLGPLEFAGAWQLDSTNVVFGGYSALVALGDGALLAASDHGSVMQFSPPGAPPGPVRIGFLIYGEARDKHNLDFEALTRDPASGDIWAAFEDNNRIERYNRYFSALGMVQPEAMRDWPMNKGPEAMTRLADGRFLILAEGSNRLFDDGVPGLLFATDPLTGVAPLEFRFVPPEGYRPVDIAQAPGGPVLILLRKIAWGIPPRFAGKLMLADPATIRAGAVWHAEPLAELAPPLPSDNFEGLAITPDENDGSVLWLISDDNNSALQRTLLLKLRWPANAKARGNFRAP